MESVYINYLWAHQFLACTSSNTDILKVRKIQQVVPIHVKTTGDEILQFFLPEMRLLFFSTLEASLTIFFAPYYCVLNPISSCVTIHSSWHSNLRKAELHALDSDIQNLLRKLVCKRESNVSPGTNINCKNTIYIVL